MSNMMCNACHKVGEPYKVPSCDRSDCPATGFGRALAALSPDPLEAQFNRLRAAAAQAGVPVEPIDWFKAGYHYANRPDGVLPQPKASGKDVTKE